MHWPPRPLEGISRRARLGPVVQLRAGAAGVSVAVRPIRAWMKAL